VDETKIRNAPYQLTSTATVLHILAHAAAKRLLVLGSRERGRPRRRDALGNVTNVIDGAERDRIASLWPGRYGREHGNGKGCSLPCFFALFLVYRGRPFLSLWRICNACRREDPDWG